MALQARYIPPVAVLTIYVNADLFGTSLESAKYNHKGSVLHV